MHCFKLKNFCKGSV